MMKSWVIVLMGHRSGVGGSIKVWRTYEGDIWDSPLDTVMGYNDGSYREAMKFAKEYLVCLRIVIRQCTLLVQH